jgi:hypothetical protein
MSGVWGREKPRQAFPRKICGEAASNPQPGSKKTNISQIFKQKTLSSPHQSPTMLHIGTFLKEQVTNYIAHIHTLIQPNDPVFFDTDSQNAYAFTMSM